MMMFPDVQQKAQEQLDRVVGSDRLPTFEDSEELPYITAVTRYTFHPFSVQLIYELIDFDSLVKS